MTREIDTSHAIQRVSVPALDRILGWAFPALDHGHVRVIDYMGDDGAIVQAARVSYGAGTTHKQTDQGLLNYLMRHEHGTPFEMCEIKLHVKLPVFVARQWIRHRIASVNEYSARYSILKEEFYIPDPDNMAKQSAVNNQGRGVLLDPETAQVVRQILIDDAANCYQSYEHMVKDEKDGGDIGLARELARMNLPMNVYTEWYWKTNLRGLFNFTRLRADSHAQFEIRVYAEIIENIIADWVPHAFSAYVKYQKDSLLLSQITIPVLRTMLDNPVSANTLETFRRLGEDNLPEGFSKGEWRETIALIDRIMKDPSQA